MSGKTEKVKGFDQTIYGISGCECKWNNISDLKNELKHGILGGMESEWKGFFSEGEIMLGLELFNTLCSVNPVQGQNSCKNLWFLAWKLLCWISKSFCSKLRCQGFRMLIFWRFVLTIIFTDVK